MIRARFAEEVARGNHHVHSTNIILVCPVDSVALVERLVTSMLAYIASALGWWRLTSTVCCTPRRTSVEA